MFYVLKSYLFVRFLNKSYISSKVIFFLCFAKRCSSFFDIRLFLPFPVPPSLAGSYNAIGPIIGNFAGVRVGGKGGGGFTSVLPKFPDIVIVR